MRDPFSIRIAPASASSRGLLATALAIALCVASAAPAQTVSSPTEGLYRPGRYMPLRIETPVAGVVRVRGADVQGIDWHAAGASSVVVPLMIYRESLGELELTVNDKPVRLPRRPVDPRAAWPSAAAELDAPATGDPRLSAFADAPYRAVASWNGGRSYDTRRAAVLGSIAATLVFGAVLLVPNPRARAVAAVAVSLASCGLIAALARPEPDRRSMLFAHAGITFDWLLYLRSASASEQTVPWRGEPRVLVRSLELLTRIDPVLNCDAAGQPVSIRLKLPPDETVAVLRLRMAWTKTAINEGERAVSTELARHFYGQTPTITPDNVMEFSSTSQP